MKRLTSSLFVASALLLVACGAEEAPQVAPVGEKSSFGKADQAGIEALADWSSSRWSSASTVLGLEGLLGPLGDNAWNPDLYISGDQSLAWSDLAHELTANDGPLSEAGPLGPDGPLGSRFFDDAAATDFERQLKGGGVWTPLGPVGPLGALGPLGPLGPVGAHGYRRDDDGQYTDEAGEVVRTVEVEYEGAARRYELFESYDVEFASEMDNNDTSFMASGALWPGREPHTIRFQSHEDQLVTIVVVPESASMFLPQAMSVVWASAAMGFATPPAAPRPRYTTDDFDMTLSTADGVPLAMSNTEAMIDWIQIGVTKGAELALTIEMYSSWDAWGLSPISGRYRVYVVGSTAANAPLMAEGPHLLRAGTFPSR